MNDKTIADVETKQKTLVVGKESSEVVDAIGELISDIKAGKDVAAIATENLSNLMEAVKGYEMISLEAKHSSRNATAAYGGFVLAEALAPVKEA